MFCPRALGLAKDEWGASIHLSLERAQSRDELPALDITVKQKTGVALEAAFSSATGPTQGGGLKRQLDKVLPSMQGKTCFMLRASDFPPNNKNQTAQAFRKFRETGGRSDHGADPGVGAHDDGARIPRPP